MFLWSVHQTFTFNQILLTYFSSPLTFVIRGEESSLEEIFLDDVARFGFLPLFFRLSLGTLRQAGREKVVL